MIGRIREPLKEEFVEEEAEMAGELSDFPSLLPSKKSRKTVIALAKGKPSQSKRAPTNAEANVVELKKQRLVLGSGSGKDARKDKVVANKSFSKNALAKNETPS